MNAAVFDATNIAWSPNIFFIARSTRSVDDEY